MSDLDDIAPGVSGSIVAFKPHHFEGAKQFPRQHTRWMLDFCQRVFRREPDETQQFLDVGCGIGDLTQDELLPRCLPCRRIVAVDVSADMVEHAARHYHHDRLDFRKLDIGKDRDVAEFIDEHGLFDRVYSFHAITWVRDQAKALKNVARLLKPRGECLFIFPSSVRSVDVNRNLVKMQRWSKYSHVVHHLAPNTQDMNYEECITYISRLLNDAGLSPSILELPVSTAFDNHSVELLAGLQVRILRESAAFYAETKRHYHKASKSPLSAAVSDDEKQQFLIDLAHETAKMHSLDVDRSRYRTCIIKASKTNCCVSSGCS